MRKFLGYTDFDWASSAVDRRSTSRHYFSKGSTMIFWSSRRHGSIALNTAKVEYIANDAS